MPRHSKKSILFPTQQTFPCPVQGCRTQVRSRWGFTQHVGANHPGMVLQYPGNEGELVQFPSSDIDQISSPASPPPSPNAFFQDEPDIHFRSDWGPSDFDLDGNAAPIPADLDFSESDLGDVAADSTEFHPFINGM
jgi:hypothetical protein